MQQVFWRNKGIGREQRSGIHQATWAESGRSAVSIEKAESAMRTWGTTNLGALGLSFVLCSFLFTVRTAQAQAPSTTDPFAAMNRELSSVVEFHVEQAAEGLERFAAPGNARVVPAQREASVRSSQMIPTENIFARVSPGRVSAARHRLLALGVDAAQIFAGEGVPVELLLVAGVESNYNPSAFSAKGARGMWQLMPETAARFGLRVDKQLDERVHPVRSTRAAAQYLRELYGRFGDWSLALAAYNAGEARVATAVERGSTHDFWQLAARKLLPDETRRYVPAFLAPAAPK